jgi:hypothetical protein
MLNDSNELVSQPLKTAMQQTVEMLSAELIGTSLSRLGRFDSLASDTSQSLQLMKSIKDAGSQGLSSSSLFEASSAKGTGDPIGRASILDGLLLSPIIKGLIGLFRGSPEAPVVGPSKYLFPSNAVTSVGAEVQSDGSAALATYDGTGGVKRVQSSNPTINIRVDALDARSIIDRSDDIAAAVRQAVLSNSSLNDTLGEI